MATYLMGIDAGHSSVKVVLFDTHGNIISVASRHTELLPRKTRAYEEFDVNANWENVADSIRECVEKSGVNARDIVGVGATTYGNGGILMDKDGNVLAPGVLPQDHRGDDILDDYREKGVFDRLNDITKAYLFFAQPGPVARWFKVYEPEIYQKTAHLLLYKSYITYKLTGVYAGDLNSYGGSAFMDLEKMEFTDEMFELFGIPEMKDKVPHIVDDCSDIVGRVHEEASKRTGLAVGTAVVAGMMDVLACLVGADAGDPGVFTCIAGTWSINQTSSNSFLVKEGKSFFNMPYLHRGKYLVSRSTGASACNYEWFANVLGGNARIEAEKQGENRFDVMNRLIGSIPPGGTTVFYHPFIAQPSLHVNARASLFNMELSTSFAEVCHAVAEGTVFIHKHHVDEMIEAGVPCEKIRLTGGIARSDVWAQMFADILNRPVETVNGDEIGALGVAMTAGIGAGIYRDYADAAKQAVTVRARFEPDAGRHAVYMKRYDEWTELIHCMEPYWNRA